MSAEQIELMLDEPELDRFTREALARIPAVIDALEAKGDWMNAGEICKVVGINDRQLRAIRRFSNCSIFSAPGSKGYKLLRLVTMEEFSQGIHAIHGQSQEMRQQEIDYLLAWHRLGRPAV